MCARRDVLGRPAQLGGEETAEAAHRGRVPRRVAIAQVDHRHQPRDGARGDVVEAGDGLGGALVGARSETEALLGPAQRLGRLDQRRLALGHRASRSATATSRSARASAIWRERVISTSSMPTATAPMPAAAVLTATPSTPCTRFTKAIRMVEPMRSAPTIGRRHWRQTMRGGSPYLSEIMPLTSRWLTAKKAAAAAAAPKNQPASPGSRPAERPRAVRGGHGRGGREGDPSGVGEDHVAAVAAVVDRGERAAEGRGHDRGAHQHGRQDREVVQADGAALARLHDHRQQAGDAGHDDHDQRRVEAGRVNDQEPEDREGARDRQAHRVHAVSEGQSLHPGDDSGAALVTATRSAARDGHRPGGFRAPEPPIRGAGRERRATSGRRPSRPGRRGAR